MTGTEWSRIDREIEQRVKHMTPDEIALLEHKARGGNVIAQTTLGLVYREGLEKAVDPASGRVLRFKANNTTALKWLRMAAEASFPVAQAELGEMYYAGRGVDRDEGLSRRWTERAAAAEYPRAKLNLLQLRLEEAGRSGPNGIDPALILQSLPFGKPASR